MSNFRCNIEMSKNSMIDNRLTKALEMLSVESEYILEFTTAELTAMLYQYMKDKVDIDLYEAGITIDLGYSTLLINEENESEKLAVLTQIADFFGKQTLHCSSVSQLDLSKTSYSVNIFSLFKKIFKYAAIQNSSDWRNDFKVVYKEISHFTHNEWLYNYIKNEEELV